MRKLYSGPEIWMHEGGKVCMRKKVKEMWKGGFVLRRKWMKEAVSGRDIYTGRNM